MKWEREILRQFYEDAGKDGFDFAYRYPGMNKVLQAAGRVIRTPQDRGVVLLIDDRFQAPDYRRLMPPHWSGFAPVYSLAELTLALQGFWQQNPPQNQEK